MYSALKSWLRRSAWRLERSAWQTSVRGGAIHEGFHGADHIQAVVAASQPSSKRRASIHMLVDRSKYADGSSVLMSSAGGNVCSRCCRILLQFASGCEARSSLETSHCSCAANLSADVLANTTSVGMAPAAGETPVPAAALAGYALVFDAVYTPMQTRLLKVRLAQDLQCCANDLTLPQPG